MNFFKIVSLSLFSFLFWTQTGFAQIILQDLDFWRYERLENEALHSNQGIQLLTKPLVQKLDNTEGFFFGDFHLEASYSSQMPSVQNREGKWITKGVNGYISLQTGYFTDWLSLVFEPLLSTHSNESLLDYPEGKKQPQTEANRYPSKTDSYTREGFHSFYALIPFGKWYFFVGKDHLKFGAGKHDTLHLSNSIEAMPMIRVGTQKPVDTSWGYWLFLTYIGKTESERTISNAFFSGWRLNWSTEKRIEIGISRSWFVGGEDENNSLSHTFWDLYVEFFKPRRDENLSESYSDMRNQQIVVDWRVKIPEINLVFYGELGREDHEHNFRDTLSSWDHSKAHILGVKWIDLFIENTYWILEQADTTQPTEFLDRPGGNWYNHHEFKDGWTYKKTILGHHVGTDARDFYSEIGIITENYAFGLFGNYEIQGVRRFVADRQEKKLELGFHGNFHISQEWKINYSVKQKEYVNFGFISGNSLSSQEMLLKINYMPL